MPRVQQSPAPSKDAAAAAAKNERAAAKLKPRGGGGAGKEKRARRREVRRTVCQKHLVAAMRAAANKAWPSAWRSAAMAARSKGATRPFTPERGAMLMARTPPGISLSRDAAELMSNIVFENLQRQVDRTVVASGAAADVGAQLLPRYFEVQQRLQAY